MPVYIFEPRDPIIARDGRPFSTTPGARAISLPFPLPSTTTGTIRTMAGRGADGRFNPDALRSLGQLAVRGPLLVEVGAKDEIRWLAHAPADALLVDEAGSAAGGRKQVRIKQLVPLVRGVGEVSDLDGKGLHMVGPRQFSPAKPAVVRPRFWYWQELEAWLGATTHEDRAVEPGTLGHDGPQTETRVHVGIAPATQAAAEGALFQTRGLEFVRCPSVGTPPWLRFAAATRLGLAVETGAIGDALATPQGAAMLGGERRLAFVREEPKGLPEPPPGLFDAIAATGACRVVLLTPAYFAEGFHPGWLLERRHRVTPELVGLAIDRAQVVSGWDLRGGTPKRTRRLAPAGTVLFLKLAGDGTAIREWCRQTWMTCVSDNRTDGGSRGRFRLDGFGLAVVGAWGGMLAPFRVVDSTEEVRA